MTEYGETINEFDLPWPLSPSLVATLPPELTLTPDEIATLEEPWQYLEALLAKLDCLEGCVIDPSAEVSPHAFLEGPIWIAPGAKIMHGAILKGPVFADEGSFIGDLSIVRASYIGKGAKAGEDSRIVRSIVGPEGEMHGMGLRDSITGRGVHLAATSSTPNARLDGGYVKAVNIHGQKTPTDRTHLGAIIGDGVSVGTAARIMPGVKIGHGSLVGPGVHVYQDLPDRHKIVLKQPVNISEL